MTTLPGPGIMQSESAALCASISGGRYGQLLLGSARCAGAARWGCSAVP